MVFNNLSEWLDRIKSLHSTEMDLSLERVTEVARRLNLLTPRCPVIIIGGTNGKGSCVATLEKIYQCAGFCVGAFTSPFLFQHNETVRMNGEDASDEKFCDAFSQIEKACGDITLTPFEFNTLAALIIFQQSPLDVFILEVGLGGRLDAVNILNADVAIVASVAIDHAEILGDTREKIAREKMGIFRSGKPAICGDVDVPISMREYCKENNIPLFCQGEQFGFGESEVDWDWWSKKNNFKQLPLTNLQLQNVSTALMAVELLQDRLPVSRHKIDTAITQLSLPGRIQVVRGKVTRIFDVSHNPAAAEKLAQFLQKNPCNGKTRAVFSMLSDKDISSTLSIMKNTVDEWYTAALTHVRAATKNSLEKSFQQNKIKNIFWHETISDAYHAALASSEEMDRVVVFGSFHTVSGCCAVIPQ